jgi:hypothetical protein
MALQAGPWAMTRKTVIFLFALYFFAALALGVFEEVQNALTSSDPAGSIRVGTILMRAAGLYFISGILPMIGWGFSDFRLQNALVPLYGWGLVLFGLETLIIVFGD